MKQRLISYLPWLTWGRTYNRQLFRQDLIAAFIVTVMVIPQSLAYAMLAGLPAEAGLYASILPLVGYALFGTSSALAVGPVAVIALMSASAVGQVAEAETAGYIIASISLALLSGAILMVMGIFRLGFTSNFISHPVISGFITGSALLIALSQFKHLLGVNISGENLLELVPALLGELPRTHATTLLLGASALLFLWFTRNHMANLLVRLGMPKGVAQQLGRAGPVMAVIAATSIVAIYSLDDKGIAVVGTIPAGLPPLQLPASSLALLQELFVPAMLISLVIFVESVSVAHKLALKKRERIDANQELLGLGAANMMSAFAGGLAVAGGFSRSVISDDAGARTPAAGAFTAIGIAAVALFLTPLMYYLPNAILAATIIVAVLSMADFRAIRQNWRYSSHDGAALVATLVITLLLGVTEGIMAGVALSLALYLYRTSQPHSAIVGLVPGTEHFRNVNRHTVKTSPQVLIVRVDESLYFANSRYLEEHINALVAARKEVRHVVLMCPAVNHIDASALESLEAINTELSDMGIKLHLSEVKGPVMDRLRKSRFLSDLNGEVFLTTYQAWTRLAAAATVENR
ncbi:MAG: sulfate permease [Marinobacter sp.]|nr:sulfate permease [Marinobacter sp.]